MTAPECRLPPRPDPVDPQLTFPRDGRVELSREEYGMLIVAHFMMRDRLVAAEACIGAVRDR